MSNQGYSSHRAYLEASRQEWLYEVNRTDERMTDTNRADCRRLLQRTIRALEFLGVDTSEITDLPTEKEPPPCQPKHAET